MQKDMPKIKGLSCEESKELWNILNTEKISLCQRLEVVENLMHFVELRTNMERSTRIFIEADA